MLVHPFTSPPYFTNTYLIADSEKRGAIIDPTNDIERELFAYVEENQIQIEAIYLTHSHFDHIASLASVKRKFDVPVWVHLLDAGNVRAPGSDGLPQAYDVEATAVDCLFEEDQRVKVGSLEFLVIHTPGHSPGGVCFYFEKERVLISGDTLFRGAIGRLDLPTSEPEKMVGSLRKLGKLPADVKVYPGHNEPTTIGEENPLGGLH